MWHVSNELGCHNALCYCDASAVAFRSWLEARYGSLAELNAAWGTSFWSQRYSAWDQILPPMAALSLRNPGQLLDFQRFSSDQQLELYRAEAEIIRLRSAAPVTTNFMVTAHIRALDYFSWAGEMDVIANDHYLDRRLADPIAELSFAADLTRGLAAGTPWLLMETSTGAVNWQPHNLAKGEGELLRNVVSHVARGADGICFFQWRASAQGAEKFHSALLPHAGTETAQWRSVLEVGRTLRDLQPIAGTRVASDAAVLFDWESWWALENEGRPSEDLRYLDQVHAAHAALTAAGVSTDVVSADADLSAYRLVVVPALHLVRDADADRLARFVEAGGPPSSPSRAGSSTRRTASVSAATRVRSATCSGSCRRSSPPSDPRRSSPSTTAAPARCGRSACARSTPRSTPGSPTVRRRGCPPAPVAPWARDPRGTSRPCPPPRPTAT